MSDLPRALIDRLRAASHLVVLTGSGVSAASGIPTFRGTGDGLWSRYRPEDLATPEAFARDPALVWQWYQWRRSLIDAAPPNPAHVAIAALARRLPLVTLITQNVDGLHQRAGSQGVIEFHGNIHRNRCDTHGVQEVDVVGRQLPPQCPHCERLLRPDVVWFGEAIPPAALQASQDAVLSCDAMLVAGTAGQVYPAAGLAELAAQRGALLIEANIEPTPLTSLMDYCLSGPSDRHLPQLHEALTQAERDSQQTPSVRL